MTALARLWELYRNEIHRGLAEELSIRNPMAVPRLEKIVVSMGTGSPSQDKTRLEAAAADLTRITGQKPQIRRAGKSVSNFKIREDMDVGCRVTLRGRRMYEFVDRLINTAIPRLRDFRGLNPRSFDGRGNYSMGVPDQSIFPEIDVTKVAHSQGMNITFVTTSPNDSNARALLTRLGMPFRRGTE
jgi:large subunit ribosomal protein L5